MKIFENENKIEKEIKSINQNTNGIAVIGDESSRIEIFLYTEKKTALKR